MSLYPPPRIIEAQVFTRLPDRFRMKGRRCAWADANAFGGDLHAFLEGPAFDRAGRLYLVDVPWGRIFRVSPAGEVDQVAEYDGEPNGLAIHRDGRIFVADYKQGVLLLDPETGRVSPLLERYRVEGFKGLNDLTFASTGDLYFTDQGLTGLHDPTGRVYRLATDGRLACLVDTLPSPNGLVLDLAEKALLVAVTRGNAVWRVPLLPDGGTAKVGLFVQLSGGLAGPDGLALTEEGGVCVAHAGNGCVWVFDRLGRPLYRVTVPEGLLTTNIAFGGPENRTLVIVESGTGTICRADLPVAGRRLFSHA